MILPLALLLVAWAGIAEAAPGLLDASWGAPTTNADGSTLTDLGSYRVYYSTGSPCRGATFLSVPAPTPVPVAGTRVGVLITGIASGTSYNVTVTALDVSGNESACAPPMSAVARLDPTPPPPVGISLVPPVLAFSGVSGAPAPATLTVKVTTSNGAAWASKDTCSFFNVTAESGASGGTHQLVPSPGWAALPVGVTTCPITYSANGLTSLVQTVTATKQPAGVPPPVINPTLQFAP